MADMALQVVVSPLLGVVFDKLSSPLLREFGLLWGVEKDLEKLSRTSSTVSRVLEDAELKQIDDATTRDWLRKLKEVAYESDDIVDECMTEALYSPHSEVSNGSCSTQVCDSFSTCFDFKRLKLRHKIAKRIKEVREKFDAIAEERKFHLNESAISRGPIEDINHSRESSSVILEECVYGRDLDKEKIIRVLLNSASNEKSLLVYSIVGIGGLGKTTLAQCVYNDTSVQENFQSKIWVCVSEDFNATRLTKEIIESVSGAKCDLENLDALQNRLKELLSGKKFLLVLDDVWNEDQGKWDKLKFPLKCGAHGSSIIVTTRSSSVAQIMDALPANQHRLAPLLDEECWSLFKGRAFGGEVIENSELERIGKEIVKKCGGVPLAAKALGGSLRLVREVNEWKSICNSAIWELREDDGILPSLRLSYNHLSPVMKQCFAFCSIFPKDHEINRAVLIQLWMANGLLQSEGTLDLEDVGRRTFKQLVWRSFFQDVKENRYGELICKMHDLMHDLACLVSENECRALDGNCEVVEIPKSTRHLSINNPKENSIPINILKCLSNSQPFLRTFLLMGTPYRHIAFESQRCLRVLDLSFCGIKVIPASIGKMKHLRYLDLSGNFGIVCLPLSLCELINLQILKLRGCESLEKLPEKMNRLVNLIHLDLYGCSRLTQMPVGIGEWTRLRTLGRFVVGSGNAQSIKELGKLDQLGGYLEIVRLEQVRDATEARLANLAAKTNLVTIKFDWGFNFYRRIDRVPLVVEEEEVFEALQPHQDFRGRLQILWYGGSRFPSWIQNLEKLSQIFLCRCWNCEDLPPLGHLPFLKKLEIWKMDGLKRISKEFYGTSRRRQNLIFPSLEELRILDLRNLAECEAPDDTNSVVFPCLEKLEVSDCPKLALLPSATLSSLQSLVVSDCENLVVSSLPCLPRLSIHNSSSIPVGSLQNLEALKSLEFNNCEFPSIPEQIFEQLTSLKYLYIINCNTLASLSHSLQHLSSLHTLYIKGCKELEFSSADFQHLRALQTLRLYSLPKLMSLPDLPTIQTLEISSCENLKVLPRWLQNLTSLHTLRISKCEPDLESKCKKDTGEYWPFISHIPNLHISRGI